MDIETLPVETDTDHVDTLRSYFARQREHLLPLVVSGRIHRVTASDTSAYLDCHPNPAIVDEKIDLTGTDPDIGGDQFYSPIVEIPGGDALADGTDVGAGAQERISGGSMRSSCSTFTSRKVST